MKSDKIVLLSIFVLTLFASAFSLAAAAAPQNACLMIPEVVNGQSAANEYNPDSCIASTNEAKPEFLAVNSGFGTWSNDL